METFLSVRKDLEDHVFGDNKISRVGLQFFAERFTRIEEIVYKLTIENAVLSTRLQERTEVLSTLMKMGGSMGQRGAPGESSQPVPQRPTSYASVAAGPALLLATIPAPRHAVVIRPTQADAKVDKDTVLKSLEPVLRKAKLSKVRQLGERGLLIESPSVLDISKIKDSAPLKEAGFTARDPIKPAPKMLIYDVPSGMTDADLASELYERNLEEAGLTPDVKAYIRPRFKVGPKGKGTEHRVVEMPGAAMKAIQTIGRVYLQYGSHRAREYMDTARCYKCQRFGHKQEKCQNAVVCGHCSAKGHKIADCPKKAEAPTCSNCLARKQPADHLVTSASCPEWLRAVSMYTRGVNYE